MAKKIKIDKNLFARAKEVAEIAGYSSVNEFVVHIIEKELSKFEADNTDEKITERLRGLGYIE